MIDEERRVSTCTIMPPLNPITVLVDIYHHTFVVVLTRFTSSPINNCFISFPSCSANFQSIHFLFFYPHNHRCHINIGNFINSIPSSCLLSLGCWHHHNHHDQDVRVILASRAGITKTQSSERNTNSHIYSVFNVHPHGSIRCLILCPPSSVLALINVVVWRSIVVW